MRTSLLIVLLLSVLLVAETEGGWFRRAKNKVKKAFQKVKDFVKTHGPKIISILAGRKKRSVDDIDAQKALELVLGSCAQFGLDETPEGLSLQAVIDAFKDADEDGNAHLDQDELELFEGMLEVAETCLQELTLDQPV